MTVGALVARMVDAQDLEIKNDIINYKYIYNFLDINIFNTLKLIFKTNNFIEYDHENKNPEDYIRIEKIFLLRRLTFIQYNTWNGYV